MEPREAVYLALVCLLIISLAQLIGCRIFDVSRRIAAYHTSSNRINAFQNIIP